MRRDDAVIALDVDKRKRIEVLGIDHHPVNIGENLVLITDSNVVAERGKPVTDLAVADLLRLKGLDHPLLFGEPPDRFVA